MVIFKIKHCDDRTQIDIDVNLHIKQKKFTTSGLHICMYLHWKEFQKKLKLNLYIADGNVQEQTLR